MSKFKENIITALKMMYGKQINNATTKQLYNAISSAAMMDIHDKWNEKSGGKRASYLSAEFLMGRLFTNNLMNMGLLEECKAILSEQGIDINIFEEIDDDALGNGGLGRLAACFLDSAATQNINLNGYGIRYQYGLFKQKIINGYQNEVGDNWLTFGDPWSVRKDEDTVMVHFADMDVKAVPYDMPIIGWQGKTINTLRLWQSEPIEEFDFHKFNEQDYTGAVENKNNAENITKVLYPNDDTREGKKLRLRQQYFFSSASLQSMIRDYLKSGKSMEYFADDYAIQLNDTHPTIAIPELLRILMSEFYLDFEKSFEIVYKTFAYTNHTVMAEALEKWDASLLMDIVPDVYAYIVMLQNKLTRELNDKNISKEGQRAYSILRNNTAQMANMAVYTSHATNGVARIHTEILKESVFSQWNAIYPNRIVNKTNGITQRRWLALCNPKLSSFITELIGDGWITDLDELKKLLEYKDNTEVLAKYRSIKEYNKKVLADHVAKYENVKVNTNAIFDIQIKRLHEYKRQMLNAFAILDTYYGIKEGRIKNFVPTVWFFGGKAAPGYYRAKAIIKLINEIARLVNNDPDTKDVMQVLFVNNYNVSYAEKLIPAANVSEQISTAGTEASGTGNMKLMLNGAVTLGTLDGANIEIIEEAGAENNYIFGATVEEIKEIKDSYNPMEIYKNDKRIAKVLDSLIDGTLDDNGSQMFKELYNSILYGASWHAADHYYLLKDFHSYCDTRLKLNQEYQDQGAFYKKCFINTACAGKFSSDRTVKEYAKGIWNI